MSGPFNSISWAFTEAYCCWAFLFDMNKNLTTEEYAKNLIAYLSDAHCCKTITVEDLNNVMRGIMSRSSFSTR